MSKFTLYTGLRESLKNRPTLALIRVGLLIGLIATFTINHSVGHSAQAQEASESESAQRHVYLPTIIKTEIPSYTLLPQEAAVESLLVNDPGQKRTTLKLNPTLSAQARQKAQDMADRRYFGHVDPEGRGPNFLVRSAGYVLPSYYSTAKDGNNIESIGAGYTTAQAAWDAWKGSSGHRMHLLGEHEFYQEQIEYGIGYAYAANGSFGHYWVVLISKPGQ